MANRTWTRRGTVATPPSALTLSVEQLVWREKGIVERFPRTQVPPSMLVVRAMFQSVRKFRGKRNPGDVPAYIRPFLGPDMRYIQGLRVHAVKDN